MVASQNGSGRKDPARNEQCNDRLRGLKSGQNGKVKFASLRALLDHGAKSKATMTIYRDRSKNGPYVGCVKRAPAARGGQDVGITQPGNHSIADPCTYLGPVSSLSDSDC